MYWILSNWKYFFFFFLFLVFLYFDKNYFCRAFQKSDVTDFCSRVNCWCWMKRLNPLWTLSSGVRAVYLLLMPSSQCLFAPSASRSPSSLSLRMRTQSVHQLPCPPIVLVSSTSPSPRIIIPTASLPLTFFFLKVRDKNLVMRICESGITLTTEPRPTVYGLLLSGDRPRTVDHHLMGCTTACLGFLNWQERKKEHVGGFCCRVRWSIYVVVRLFVCIYIYLSIRVHPCESFCSGI